MIDTGAIDFLDDLGRIAVAPREVTHRQLHPQLACIPGGLAQHQPKYPPHLGFRIAAAQTQVAQLPQATVAPSVEKADEEVLVIFEMPIETAARDGKSACEREHAHVIEAAFGNRRGGGVEPGVTAERLFFQRLISCGNSGHGTRIPLTELTQHTRYTSVWRTIHWCMDITAVTLGSSPTARRPAGS